MKRKKIGVLTYHRAVNYGAFLQCYSLVSALSKRFPQCDVEVIDFETPTEFINRLKGIIHSQSITDFIKKLSLYSGFYKSLSLLPLSKKRVVSNSEKAVIGKWGNYYDIIIVGSDAVWNNVISKGKINFFLNGDFKGQKYSYAASTNGLPLNCLNDEKIISFLNASLKEFSYIGLREEKGEHVVSTISKNLVYHHNCDPVCFLNTETHLDKIVFQKLEKHSLTKKPIVCLMTKNERVGQAVWSEYHITHNIVSVYTYNKYADVVLYDLTPLEFVAFYKYVDILFSYFFHGCYTCLKNGKPAIAVDEDFDGIGELTKICDLYRRLGINNWYYRPNDMQESDFSKMIALSRELINSPQETMLANAIKKESTFSTSFFDSIEKEISNE